MRSSKQGFPSLVLALVAVFVLALAGPVVSEARKGKDGHGKGHRAKGKGKGKGKHHRHKRKRHPRPTTGVNPRLLPFDSCDALEGYADAQAQRTIGANYRPVYRPWVINPNDPLPAPAAGGSALPVSAPVKQKKSKSSGSKGGESEFGDFSKTNTQEKDVDEPDIVKTDGKTIFAIGGGTLNAIDARAAAPNLVGSMPLEGTTQQMLLVGSRLLVLANDTEVPPSVDPAPDPDDPPLPDPDAELNPHQFDRQVAVLTEIDVSNPAQMTVVSSERMAGRYVSARLVDSAARVVITSPPAATTVPEKKLVSPLASWVPFSHFHSDRTGDDSTGPIAGECGDVSRPDKFSGLSALTVLTIDMNKGLPAIDSDEIMSDGQIVYASANSLYVSTGRDGRFIKGDPSRAETALHRFDISSPTTTTYAASGTVRGTLLNQFSMSEYNGYLRVVSTGYATGKGDGNGTESFLSVYQQQGPELVRIARVGSLGAGERVQGVRMVGDIGYVVTFRRVDPLYTVDLSNPADPRVVGELKILGYSAYLHPISDNKLIGVGPDSDEYGSRLGAQISLFDVSNLKEPKRLAHKTVPGGRTAIEDTHLAFLYWEPQRLAVMPVTTAPRRTFVRPIKKPKRKNAVDAAKRPRRPLGPTPTGAYGYRIGKGKIRQVGTIVHRAVVPNGEEIERSLVVGDKLFTLSCRGVGVTPMVSFTLRDWVPFVTQSPRACVPLEPVLPID